MSEITSYKRTTLGETEQSFLKLISEGPKSAYEIFKYLRGKASIFKTSKPMAYKNVHRRIKRLNDLGLVEEVAGNFRRRAKKYGLTSHGLFQCLITGGITVSWSILDLYKENVILQTILFQYFEVETIEEFSSSVKLLMTTPVSFILYYLKKCCEAILEKLERARLKFKRLEERGRPATKQKEALNVLIKDIDESIMHEIKDFVFKIVTDSGYQQQDKDEPDPNLILSKDKKFIGLLHEIKKDFDDGCKNFIGSQ